MRPFELLKLFKLFALRTTRYTLHAIFLLSFLILTLALTSQTYAAPQMADYCYLPPFVMDPNTPPNIMIVYEKGDNTLKRAYKGSDYDKDTTYGGFFDSNAYYTYDSVKGYFKKANSPAVGDSYNWFPGNLLNWAFTSNLDITREVFYGFGWPKASGGSGAGDIFTYKGCFIADSGGASASTCEGCSDIDAPPSGCQSPVSKGQWEGETGETTTCLTPTSVNIGGTNYSYAIQIRKASGASPTGIDFIRVKVGDTPPSCSGKCLVGNSCYMPVSSGNVKVRFGKSCSKNSAKACTSDSNCSPTDTNGVCQWDNRSGFIQEYADKDQDYTYDSDAPRFGLRRWATSTAAVDRNRDILCDATGGNCTLTIKTTLLRDILNATSKEPATETGSAPLGDMMRRIVYYFNGTATGSDYADKDDVYTQTPYKWSTDPAKKCRKTFAFFVTTGADMSDGSPLSSTCTSGTDSTAFSQNTCYAYSEYNDINNNGKADLWGTEDDGEQNIRSYIVHMDFYGNTCTTDAQCPGQYCDTNKKYCRSSAAKLQYAADKGGGQYISVSDPTKLRSVLEEALLNILSTSASASTVATLTTQTRESSTLTQAYFYPKKEGTPLRWIGYLRLLWSDSGANLREDTMNKGWLDLKKDKILSFWYSATGCSGGPCYRAMLFNDIEGDLKIDSCYTPTVGNTIDNEVVSAIWNAQSRLQSRSPDDRMIKVGIGTSGKCNNNPATSCTSDSDCCSGGVCQKVVTSSGMNDFTAALKNTFQPYWNISSFCSNNTSRWCAITSDCNYCTANPNRSCSDTNSFGADPDCNYCTAKTTLKCSDDSITGGCYLSDYGACNTTGGLYCSDDSAAACATLGDLCGAGGVCKYKCSIDATRYCSTDDNCMVNYGPCVTTDTCITSGFTCNAECDPNCAESTIKFARGYDKPTPSGSDFRLRQSTDSGNSNETNTLKLGDIVYSTPRISPNSAVNGYDVTYKDDTYGNFVKSTTIKNATPIVIVGANDGMVHAFKVGKIKDVDNHTEESADGYQTGRFSDEPPTKVPPETVPPTDCSGGKDCIGKELWAYIPWNAVPYLKWYCSESYCHIPMVDARFTVIDASIDYNGDGVINSSDTADTATRTISSWRRLLIGAMGVGGRSITVGSNTWSSSIFVLDITNPASPTLLWERPLPDSTLTTSTPAIIRLASAATEASKLENGKWYLVFGSGPESITTNRLNYKTGNANIYAFDLRTGNLEATLPITGTSGVAVGDMMGVDFDSDYQVDDIYFGTYGGAGTGSNPFKGKLYRLRIREDASYQKTPANWDIETVVIPGGGNGRPIYAGAEIAQDAIGNKWLYFGTGLYLTLEHAKPRCSNDESLTCNTDSDCGAETCGANEYLYAVKETDDCWKGGGSCSTYSSFLDTSGISFTGATAVEVGCFCAGSLLKPFSCTNGNCDGTCTGGACSNNTSLTCASNNDCKCASAEQKVVTKVTDATLSESGVITTGCAGKKDKAAIDCLSLLITSSKDGWYRTIPKQKSFSKPFVAGGLADFTSFEPKSTVCSLGGDTHLWALHYTTGTAYVQPTISMACGTSDGDGNCGATTNLTISASVNLGTGVPPLGESLVALPLSGDTYKVITQVSGGLPGTSMAPSLPAKGGYVLWIVK